MRSLTVTGILVAILLFSTLAIAQEGSGIDPEAIIEQILMVEQRQYQQIDDDEVNQEKINQTLSDLEEVLAKQNYELYNSGTWED